MMALRTKFGLNMKEWNLKYQNDFKVHYASVLHKYRAYFCFDGECIFLNDAGLEILNTILVDFMLIE